MTRYCFRCCLALGKNEPRVWLGDKVFHGQCFVQHCKETHKPKPQYNHEEADAMEDE